MRSRNSKLQKQPHKLDIFTGSIQQNFIFFKHSLIESIYRCTCGVSLNQLLLTSILDPLMSDCLMEEEEVKNPYPMTTSCFLQIHVVQVNQDHQTETKIALKMLDFTATQAKYIFRANHPQRYFSILRFISFLNILVMPLMFYPHKP